MTRRSMHALVGAATLGLLALAAAPARAQVGDDALGRAMRDELERSMKELRLGDLERPYFIAYRVTEVRWLHAEASHGSSLGGTEMRTRTLDVELRVGDYRFDNTNFFGGASGGMVIFGGGGGGMSFAGSNELPLDDDYLAIRRKIWLATDGAYKQALETLAAKRAAMLNRERRDSLPDFSKEPPTRTSDEVRGAPTDRPAAEALVRELSAAPELAGLGTSSVSLSAAETRAWYVNSEGTSFTRARPLVTLHAAASTQAVDGMPLGNALTIVAPSLDALPRRDELLRRVRALGARLDSLRRAPTVDRYSGPVLFEGAAAAELFGEIFVPGVLARRRMLSGMPEMEEMFSRMEDAMGSSLADRLGGRVLPDFLSVVDDPTAATYGGAPLLGGYKVDDEGVAAHRTPVVEGGILRTLLSTRTPVEGIERSTGNRRHDGPAPSNVLVRAEGGVSDTELKARLIAMVRKRGLPYGVLVRELGGGGEGEEERMMMLAAMSGHAGAGRSLLRAYRVYPDGREELVRAARLARLSAESFKDIVAVSSAATVHHAGGAPGAGLPMFAFLFGGSGSFPVASYVVPSLLFDDVALTKPVGELPRPPLIVPPAPDPE